MKKLFLPAIFFFISHLCSAQAWSNLGNGFDADVNALCVYNNQLYAAGNFTHDYTSAVTLTHIARWTGSTWVELGSGVDGNVSAMTVFDNALYVGGDFTNAGGAPASKIAKWNGTSWSPVSTGFNNTVKCLYVWNNELYAGGSFTMDGPGTNAIKRIARLNGSVWEAVGNLTSGIVNTMIEYEDTLYIGGTWSAPYINKLSGNTWVAISGTGEPNYYVRAFAVFKYSSVPKALWIGGEFSNRLKTYTSAFGYGSSNNPFGGGNLNALCGTHSFLYAGGEFTVLSASRLARYSGSTPWDTVGATPNSSINAFTVYNGHLVAGGIFTTMGINARHIAIKNTLVGIEEMGDDLIAKDFYPNPFNDHAMLRIQSNTILTKPELTIYDITGRVHNRISGVTSFNKSNYEFEFGIERSGLPAGIYFYRLSDDAKAITTGKFIVE